MSTSALPPYLKWVSFTHLQGPTGCRLACQVSMLSPPPQGASHVSSGSDSRKAKLFELREVTRDLRHQEHDQADMFNIMSCTAC